MIEPRKMVRFGFGTSLQREERSSPSSHVLSRPESRSSASDRNKSRDAAPFSSFRQRWVSNDTKSELSRKANKDGLSSSGFFETRSDRKPLTSSSGSSSKHEILGRSSPLTKLKEFHFARETRSSSTSNRTGSGVGSRSNLALAERLAGTSFGRSQPLFENRKTFQIHESRQTTSRLRDGGAASQVSERSGPGSRSRSGSLSGESVSRSRSGSLSSRSGETRGLLQEQGQGSESYPQLSKREGSGTDRKTFRYQQTEQSVRKESSLIGADATVSSYAIEERLKRHKQRLAEKMAKANKGGESPAASRRLGDSSSILQRILSDRSRPFHNRHESSLASRSTGAMISRQEQKLESKSMAVPLLLDGSTTSVDSQKTAVLQKRTIGDTTDGKKDELIVLKSWEKKHSREEQHLDDQSGKVLGRKFKSAVAQVIEAETKLQDGTKDSVEGQSSSRPSTAMKRIAEKVEAKQEDVVDSNSKTGTQSYVRRRFEHSNITEVAQSDIAKKNVISTHIDLDGVIKINQAIANEIKERKKSGGVQEFKIQKTNAISIPRSVSPKPGPSVSPKPGPSVSPKPGPRTSPKPSLAVSPKQEIALGGGEKIKIAVQLAKDDTQGDNEVFQDSDGPGSSVEIPQPMSVANLRNSLFGGDKPSLKKLVSRGMGGILAKNNVKLRTQQVTSERRQILSSVEVTTNGVAAMTTTRVSTRMTTKSESEAESEPTELLPSLYRFEKPRKPKITIPSRNLRRLNEPITVQLQISPDVKISKGR